MVGDALQPSVPPHPAEVPLYPRTSLVSAPVPAQFAPDAPAQQPLACHAALLRGDFHDHERLYPAGGLKVFAIMKTPLAEAGTGQGRPRVLHDRG